MQDPATSHPFPAHIQDQCLSSEVMQLWEGIRRTEVGILWSLGSVFCVLKLFAVRAGQGMVCVWFVVECQWRETSSSFPGALSCPLRLLASVDFPSRKLLWKTSPWSCRKSETADSQFVANKFLFSVENLWILPKAHFLWTKRKQNTILAMTLSHVFLEIQPSFKYLSWELSSFGKCVLMFGSEPWICTTFFVQGLVVRSNNIGTKITASGLKFCLLILSDGHSSVIQLHKHTSGLISGLHCFH